MTIVEKITSELKVFEEKKKAFVVELQKEFPAMFAPIFAKSDKIKSFGWRQYTPYFNDGDSCKFSSHTDDLMINGEDSDDCEFLDWRMEYALRGDKKYVDELKKEANNKLDYSLIPILEEIKEILSSIPDEFYRDLFGDHVIVTVNSNGTTETEEYSHD